MIMLIAMLPFPASLALPVLLAYIFPPFQDEEGEYVQGFF